MRLLFVFASVLLLTGLSARAQRAPLVPAEVMGVETCRDCHEEQVLEWEGTAHAVSMFEPEKNPVAVAIAEKLSIDPREIPRTASCVRCHYTQEVLSGVPETTLGVSCESCHGAAADWIDVHNSRGSSRGHRVEESLRLGMAHPSSLYTISRSCFECHIVDDEQLVNGAGHPALTDGFEILSWYTGEVNHNFLVGSGDGLRDHVEELQPIPRNRKRMLYLNGKLLQLGYLLRALGGARDAPVDRAGEFLVLENGRYTYGVQLALEVRRVVGEMEDVSSRVTVPAYIEALALIKSMRFETGNGPLFEEAAESVFRIAEEFCGANDGSSFAAIDPILEGLEPRYSESYAERRRKNEARKSVLETVKGSEETEGETPEKSTEGPGETIAVSGELPDESGPKASDPDQSAPEPPASTRLRDSSR